MPGNNSPIYTRVGDIQGITAITSAAADYVGQSAANVPVFTADASNGGYIQRLRFKAAGTNNATVARVYINNGSLYLISPLGTPGIPSGTPLNSGGSLYPGTFYGKVQAVDQWGGVTAPGNESSAVLVTTVNGSITWNWTTVTNAVSYRLFTGPTSTAEYVFFTTSTNSFVQTSAVTGGTLGNPPDYATNNFFVGEISLPATTGIATAATVDVDYPLNLALPPGYRIIVGTGAYTAGNAGWTVTAIGGKY